MNLRSMLVAACAGLAPAAAAGQFGGTQIQPGRHEDVSRVATRGATFLSLGVGARPLALAGAYTGATADLSLLYWNVAGVADVQSVSVFASHEKLYGASGLTNTFVGAALPLFGGALGLSLTSFSSGDIERTTEAWPEGGDPTFGTEFSWTATAIGVHYARPLTDRLAVGATLKRAEEGIDFASATFYAADVGIRFASGLVGSTFGITLANIGSAARVDGPAVRRRIPRADNPQFPTGRPLDAQLRTEELQLPTAIRIGVRTDLAGTAESLLSGAGPHRVSLFTDVTDAIDTKIMPAVAAEYGFRDRAFVRGGVRFLNDGRVSGESELSFAAGAGVLLPVGSRRFRLDYAWRRMGDLQGNHIFSFQFGT